MLAKELDVVQLVRKLRYYDLALNKLVQPYQVAQMNCMAEQKPIILRREDNDAHVETDKEEAQIGFQPGSPGSAASKKRGSSKSGEVSFPSLAASIKILQLPEHKRGVSFS